MTPLPLWQPQLEKSADMDWSVRPVPLSPTASPNSFVEVASKPSLGTFSDTWAGIALYPGWAEPPADALGSADAGPVEMAANVPRATAPTSRRRFLLCVLTEVRVAALGAPVVSALRERAMEPSFEARSDVAGCRCVRRREQSAPAAWPRKFAGST